MENNFNDMVLRVPKKEDENTYNNMYNLKKMSYFQAEYIGETFEGKKLFNGHFYRIAIHEDYPNFARYRLNDDLCAEIESKHFKIVKELTPYELL